MATKVVNAEGKRKSAVARATVKEGKGKVRVNGQLISSMPDTYFKMKMQEPLIIAGDNVTSKVSISVNVQGGGVNGQAEAVRQAIAKGLVKWTNNKSLQTEYGNYDRTLLVADVRRKEPYKPNDSKARAKRQSSKR